MAIPGFKLRTPDDASDVKLLSDIQEYGWHVVQISGDENEVLYSFTVGLYYSFGHPEIVIVGLNHETQKGILDAAVVEIRKGVHYQDGGSYHGLTERYPCAFSTVDKSKFKEYLGYAVWFYRNLNHDFPVLQLLWSDPEGLLPGDSGFDQRYADHQKLI